MKPHVLVHLIPIVVVSSPAIHVHLKNNLAKSVDVVVVHGLN